MPANLTLNGLLMYDPNLFSEFIEPSDINHEQVLIPSILLACAELEVVYPDPDFLKEAIGVWSRRRYDSWLKIWDALSKEYNPIENYDRHEDSGATSSATSNYSGTGNSTEKVSAFDATDFANRSSVDNQQQNSNQTSATTATQGHIHGNIGVTTSQQMIEAELALRRDDYVNIICKEFRKEFCLEVW